ncbi:phosphopantetheine-binding protein [Mesorhizobium sp. M0522]|uniref:acyl carrier protein n=1 Tax=Mesorhizobium sp. M0522 TaxID=2956958 RepID=UPI003334F7BB
MSKIAGLRLSHDGIEPALEKAGIAAAVVGDDERILAMVTTPDVDDNEVLEVLMAATGLPRPHLEVGRATSLRKLASGKIDYASLQVRLRAPRQQMAMDVLDAFRNAFYPRQVGPSDTFEKLGGDSLLYVQLSLTLERELGSLPEGWETMPLGDLARTAEPRNHGWSIDSQLILRAAAILLGSHPSRNALAYPGRSRHTRDAGRVQPGSLSAPAAVRRRWSGGVAAAGSQPRTLCAYHRGFLSGAWRGALAFGLPRW